MYISHMISGYHGSENPALNLYAGICLTDDLSAAENYAEQNGGDSIYVIDVNTDGLTWVDVDYDYDNGEPILGGVEADVVEYVDCDETGRTHRTWMLITNAAIAAAAIQAR